MASSAKASSSKSKPPTDETNNSDEPSSPARSIKSSVSDDGDGKGDESSQQPSVPTQKRRRVTRACDECRRKKIKCDGKQPCTHCSVYSYECTYDKPSNRRRNPAPQYIEALENRLQRAESLLRNYMPDLDLSDPTLDPAIQQEFRTRALARKQAAKLHSQYSDEALEDTTLASMVESVGTLNLDDHGGWDFHGSSSGAMFLRHMKEHFHGMLGPSENEPFPLRFERPEGLINFGLDPAGNALGSGSGCALKAELAPGSSNANIARLPPKELARELCYYSINCATCLIRILHVPSFYELFDQIYDKPVASMTTEELHGLALLHSVLSLGYMYRNLDPASGIKSGYRDAIQDGLKHYHAARHLLKDITECRNLRALQALLFMILFLQASSTLNTCYSFVGIALRSSLRMGLHRDLKHERMTPIEIEERRRVFFVVRQLDIYVSAMLGFPLLLQADDIDQKYPSEIDDEYILRDQIIAQPPRTHSFFEAFNAHTRLMEILAKILRFIYPTKGISFSANQTSRQGSKASSTYLVSYGKIREIERDLQHWFEVLPVIWRPGSDVSIEMVRVQHLLRFSYAHVQLVLYRPFLHYVSPRLAQGKIVDEVSYACAAAAISVSRNLVHIGIEIRKQGVLIGPYWFMLYTEFFAVLSLVFYATENPMKHGTAEVLADAYAGRDILAKFAEQSMAADRVTKSLKHLFDRLPERMSSQSASSVHNRKRSITTHDELRSGYAQGELSVNPISSSAPLRTIGVIPNSNHLDPNFSPPTLGEFLPMDLSTRGTPESTGTIEGSVASRSYAASASGATIGRLNSLMFPSEDPFAYPTNPPMDMAFGSKGPAATVPQPDTTTYYPCGTGYGDLDPQLANTVPFMMQQRQQQQQAQQTHEAQQAQQTHSGEIPFSSQIYGQPANLAAAHRSPAQPTELPHRRTAGVPASVYPNPGFDADWNVFGNSFPTM
ncbi:hypothetical protein TD95_003658 [Thielaviopsis punctulata]|uniref:Zn(2)-C6 fungal-type domain-containing protein n=1 Tax=Thielaviopsis punctulata TaxID=72032 RepID=A0A0F4ZCU5_9PEZI|nr:hypothetical protein TD95_003658 [Thielaviopsis punctulata]